MPGRTPGEAVKNFLDPVKSAVSVLGGGQLNPSAHPPVGVLQVVTLNRGHGLRVRSTLYGELLIEFSHDYEVVEDEGTRGPYRCSSRGYIMSIGDDGGSDLVAYHWHPFTDSPESGPHFHLGESRTPQAANLHVQTKRMTIEEFVVVAIDTFGAEPSVDDATWRPLLDDSRALHEEHRTWDDYSAAPRFGS